MEKTFEELIDEKFRHYADFYKPILIELLQRVQEATIVEIENKANEYGEYGTADYVHELPTDRIKTEK